MRRVLMTPSSSVPKLAQLDNDDSTSGLPCRAVLDGRGVDPGICRQCSGSGITWSCSAGASSADIQNAINSASDGFTITFAAGSYALGSMINFSNTVGGTLICATAPQNIGAVKHVSTKH